MQPFSKAKNKLVLKNTKGRERKGIKKEKNKENKARKRNIDRGVQTAKRLIYERSYEQRKEITLQKYGIKSKFHKLVCD